MLSKKSFVSKDQSFQGDRIIKERHFLFQRTNRGSTGRCAPEEWTQTIRITPSITQNTDYLAAALNCRPVKAVVILIFACYLAGALYGLTTLQEGLDRRKLSKNDSYSIAFYDRQDYYFREFPYRIQVLEWLLSDKCQILDWFITINPLEILSVHPLDFSVPISTYKSTEFHN